MDTTDYRIPRIKELLEAKCSQAEIGRHLGLSAQRVGSLMKQYGLKSNNIQHRIPNDRSEQIKRLLGEGRTNKEIARCLGISKQRLHQLMRNYDVARPKRPAWATVEAVESAVEMILSGKTITFASYAIGVNYPQLIASAEEYGIKIPDRLERLEAKHKGSQFGQWTVLGGCDNVKQLLCQCSCGTTRHVWVNNLRKGLSRGCGCKNRSISGRRTMPWECVETGERLPNGAAVARRCGVTPATVLAAINRGRDAYAAPDGSSTWRPLESEAVPHLPPPLRKRHTLSEHVRVAVGAHPLAAHPPAAGASDQRRPTQAGSQPGTRHRGT
jgi:DNA-binding CsgD family transcriptional regulator